MVSVKYGENIHDRNFRVINYLCSPIFQMIREERIQSTGSWSVKSKIQDYSQLMKPNLSFMVVFSSIIGYLLVPGVSFNWTSVLVLFAGGMLVTNGANTINQIIERETDKLMNRTKTRPLPGGRMQMGEAVFIAVVSGITGSLLLGIFFNPYAGILSFISLLLYAFAYTPMKKIHPVAVFIGAIPGALPPLIGWVAATGSIDMTAWVLFLIQFFWQFPHFWAIAWVGFDDYERAGIRMLPSYDGKTRFTGMQCMIYSAVLLPLAIIAFLLNVTGYIGLSIGIIAGIGYFISSFNFYKKNDHKSAKQVMYTSFIYLPAILLAFVLDKM